MFKVIPVDPGQVLRQAGIEIDMPAMVKAVVEDDELLALYGLAWGGGRCWAWFHVENYRPGYGFRTIAEGRKCLRYAVQLGETEVYTPRDTQFETSTKLLKLLGFEFFAEENGIEVWKWQDFH